MHPEVSQTGRRKDLSQDHATVAPATTATTLRGNPMETLRTPDERFADLPGWRWTPSYAEVGVADARLRMAYIDEGPATARPILLLHGEPTWSYLYRHVIPPLLDAGLRVVAPDLVGFGRSDKPVDRRSYTYQRHVDWLTDLVVETLDLTDAILFCQDWGGLLGLRLVAEHPDRFAGVVASNTMLPTGDHPAGDAFLAWRDYSQTTKDFAVGRIVNSGCIRELGAEEVAAYDAPFPDDRYKAGARAFPALVPITPDDPASAPNRAAWESLLRWERPFLCAFGDSDAITGAAAPVLQKLIPGTKGQPHELLERTGHFCQEDAGERIAQILIAAAGSW
jgi:haloalkane dehalogenase